MTNSIAKGYNSIAELPTEVRSSFDETDQEKWMNEYNSALGDKTDESSIKQAREDAWMKMQDCPSGLSVETWGSVEVKDWDNEVVNIQSLADHCDAFIDHGGRINDVHTNLPLGSCWKWERAVHPETGQDAIKFWFNIYRDTETTERAREEILDGIKNSVSIGAEAPRGEYKCDEKGCYVERNVTDYYELSICEAPANPEANFIAINGENIAKSRHHNKGDIVFKLKEMTVHEDYTTCPIQNIKRNLIKSGIKDTHIGKDNHITTKGITRSQLLKVLKESDATCKYRETSPGVYEIKVSKSVKKSDSYYREAFWKLINDIDDMDIEDKRILNMALSDHLPDNINALKSMLLKCYENGWDGHYLASTHKSVKKSDSAMYEQLDDMIGMILSAIEDIKIYIRDGDFSTACGYANSLVETAQELEGALCNIRGEKSTRKSIKKSYNVADLDEHADYVKNFIDGMVETVKDGEYEYALEDARYLPESVGLFENIIQSIASDKSASTRKSVKKEMEGWDYESLHEIYKLLNYHLHSRVHPLIDAKMYAPTTESFINSVEEVMDDYQAQFRQSMKKELFWSSDNGDKYDADGCTVEYNEDTDGYTATIYGNGDSDKIIREFDTLQDAQRFCEDYCEKSVRKSSLAIYNLLAFMDERLDGNDKEILDYVLEKNGVHSVYQLKLALEEAYDKRYEDEQAHRDDLTESTRKSIKKTSVKKDHPYGNEHVRAIEAVLDEIYRTNIGEFNTYRLGYVNFDEGYQYVNIGGSIPAESIGKILRDEYGIDASAEIYGAIAIEMNSNGLNEYMDKSLHKDIGKDIDTNADIQQYIDEAIANGWAYESNKCVYLQKEVSEAFFKDMYDKGYLQCVSGYWGFRNEIIAKQPLQKTVDFDKVFDLGNKLCESEYEGVYVLGEQIACASSDEELMEYLDASEGLEMSERDRKIFDKLNRMLYGDDYSASTKKSLTQSEQDIYEAIKSKYTVKSHDKIKARVIKSGYTEREFDNVISYISKDVDSSDYFYSTNDQPKFGGSPSVGDVFTNPNGVEVRVTDADDNGNIFVEYDGEKAWLSLERFNNWMNGCFYMRKDMRKEGGSAGASGGSGSMGVSSNGASNTVYGEKPKEQVYTNETPKKKPKSRKKGNRK